jgi:hypothetical protein
LINFHFHTTLKPFSTHFQYSNIKYCSIYTSEGVRVRYDCFPLIFIILMCLCIEQTTIFLDFGQTFFFLNRYFYHKIKRIRYKKNLNICFFYSHNFFIFENLKLVHLRPSTVHMFVRLCPIFSSFFTKNLLFLHSERRLSENQ